jgi:hypothetical protein
MWFFLPFGSIPDEIIKTLCREISEVDDNSISSYVEILYNSFVFRRFKDTTLSTTYGKSIFRIQDIMEVCNERNFVVWPQDFLKTEDPSVIEEVVDDLVEQEEIYISKLRNLLFKPESE